MPETGVPGALPDQRVRDDMQARVENDFAFHPADETNGGVEHDLVRAKCGVLALFILHNVPAGREKALALTKVEEAMFWANAAVARNS